MKSRLSLALFSVVLCAAPAWASDLGIHAGYYGNGIKEAFVGADLSFPLGPVSLMPNVDYTKSHGVGYWWFNGDIVLRIPSSGGPNWWIGAGPTYAYFTNYYSAYPGASSTFKEWGWDATGGLGWTMAGFKPYATVRYMKVKNEKTTGAAIGLRF